MELYDQVATQIKDKIYTSQKLVQHYVEYSKFKTQFRMIKKKNLPGQKAYTVSLVKDNNK